MLFPWFGEIGFRTAGKPVQKGRHFIAFAARSNPVTNIDLSFGTGMPHKEYAPKQKRTNAAKRLILR
jgi:hypothetical protein